MKTLANPLGLTDAEDRETRPQPAVEAERGLLGCLLMESDLILEAMASGIHHRMFDDLNRSTLFRIMVQMHKAGEGIDLITVAPKLKASAQFNGDAVLFLTDLADATPSAANISFYFKPLQEAHLKLSAWKCGSELQRLSCCPGIDAKNIKEDFENVWKAMFSNVGRDMPPMVDVAEFVTEPLTEPKQLILGVLHQGSKLTLGGGSKSFKTWTLLDLALSVSHGIPWLSFPTTKGTVLYVNFEIQNFSFQRRIEAVAEAKGITIKPGAIKLWNLRGKAANHVELLPQMIDSIKGQDIALIILDPVYKLYGGADENSAGDMAQLLNGFEKLAVETGAAVAFGAHFSKGNQSGKESIDRISGSGVFARDPDSLLVMTRHETDGAFTVEATLRNFPSVEPFVVQWEYPLMRVDTGLDPAKLKKMAGRSKEHTAADLLKVLSPSGMNNQEWMQAAEDEEGVKHRTYYNLRKELEKAGKVIQSKVNQKWQPILK